ncbi:unnamed protein product [Caenorhabditis angaria]|uniref:Uncharacterized protein n=1 Tax=Caenorhabditis angaria TaxID=860376 RepID=A0A9P1J4C5_9PELO|nr:unnamed protein product [Caenorhabditis angaria]
MPRHRLFNYSNNTCRQDILPIIFDKSAENTIVLECSYIPTSPVDLDINCLSSRRLSSEGFVEKYRLQQFVEHTPVMSRHEQSGPYLGASALDTNTPDRRGLENLSKTCFIRPKSTGLASLFLQFGLLIVSGITAMFFFYHVGGYEYMQWNENSTILEPVHHNYPHNIRYEIVEEKNHPPPEEHKPHFETTILPIVETTKVSNEKEEDDSESLVSTANRSLEFLNQTVATNRIKKEEKEEEDDVVAQFLDRLLGGEEDETNSTFGIEQVPMTNVMIAGVEFDWLEVIRISTLVYLIISITWFFSMVFFIFTIKCEILDSAVFNLMVLALIVLYQFMHSFLIVALVFFQTEMSWRTMAITIGSIIILSCCAFLGCVCFALDCGWIKYIDYMHGNRQRCICLAVVVRLIKGKENQPTFENSYQMPNQATNNNDTRHYENDVPIQQFSAF